MSVFVIAEAGSSHDNDLQKGYRLIEAAKECGADAVKFQWTSNAAKMAQRRNLPVAENIYRRYLEKPIGWLNDLKKHCDKVGIEFAVTCYLIEDIATIAPLVKRFKVSAFECEWKEFVEAHEEYDKDIIISANPHQAPHWNRKRSKHLHCISEYPCPDEKLQLRLMGHRNHGGFSDHSTNVLTGAMAAGLLLAHHWDGPIIEKHIRLRDTEVSNPDYPHSIVTQSHRANCQNYDKDEPDFEDYVAYIRQVEKMI